MKKENKPFNDVIDHFNKIEGNATQLPKKNIKKFPKPIKYIGYFIVAFFSISILLMLIINFLE